MKIQRIKIQRIRIQKKQETKRTGSNNPEPEFGSLIAGHHRYAAFHPEDPEVKKWKEENA